MLQPYQLLVLRLHKAHSTTDLRQLLNNKEQIQPRRRFTCSSLPTLEFTVEEQYASRQPTQSLLISRLSSDSENTSKNDLVASRSRLNQISDELMVRGRGMIGLPYLWFRPFRMTILVTSS
jgi:hypothetical protein